VLVDDIHATVAGAKELGGKILIEPKEDLHDGRLALIADPSGAAFFARDKQ
jgi:predicted enzyme related to lactoylglutathione lyase